MPFIYDPNLDQEHQQQQAAQGVQLSGAAPVANASGSPSANQSQSKDVNSGSGFQNLDKYLSTNQSQAFGNQVLGKVGNQVQNASTQMNQAADQFANQVKSANNIPTQADINKAIANPAQANAGQFQEWKNQTYKGPTSLSDPSAQDTWNKYWSGAKQAQTSANLLGNEAGRFTLFDQYFGKPSYGFGQKSLDNLLVQQSGLGNQTRDLQNQATQLQQKGADTAKTLQELASTRAGDVDRNRNNLLSTIGIDAQGNVLTGDKAGAIGKEYQAFDDYLNQQNAARHAQQQAFKSNLAKDTLTGDDLAAMNLGNVQGQHLYDLDLNNYYTAGGDLNKDQVMTPEQRARIQALSNLAGVTDTFASSAPQAQSAAYGFDINRLRSDAAAREAAYNNELEQARASVPPQWQMGYGGDLDTLTAQAEARVADKYKANRKMGEQYASIPIRPTVYGNVRR